MNLAYYKNLDGIRAIAALMVMLFHFFSSIYISTPCLYILQKLSAFGQTGVTLFFVLSGFLITRILLNTKNSVNYFKNFYIRRILRIFPLYYLFLLIYYYLYPLIFDFTSTISTGKIYYFTYLQNIAMTFNWKASGPWHFWSLAVEEHFYLFWPLVVYFLTGKNLFRFILLIIIGALVLRIYMLTKNYEVFYFTFTRFDSLAIGSLLAVLELKQVFKPENSNKLLVFANFILIPTIILWTFYRGEANIYIQVFKYVLLSFAYFLLIAYVLSINEDKLVNRILKSGFFSYTGKISYGLYVYHPFAYLLSRKFIYDGFWPIALFFTITVSYILASISYYFYESNFLKLKKYFDYTYYKPIPSGPI